MTTDQRGIAYGMPKGEKITAVGLAIMVVFSLLFWALVVLLLTAF